MDASLLKIRDLKKHFPVRGGPLAGVLGKRSLLHAVDGISFDIRQAETFGLVGESGCGKSTTGRLIVRLLEPTSGSIIFGQDDISRLSGAALLRMRRKIQMVFQNPYASLDPRWSVQRILAEPLLTHGIVRHQHLNAQVAELLAMVGLDPDYMYRYPHQFSGGQRQRIALARALAVNPSLLVADEPVSALDVSIQAQILNLMQDLQEQFRLSILFISHDLSVVRYLSDRVGVMYLGRLVEVAPVEELYTHPVHPYTQALLSSIPVASLHRQRKQIILEGEVPSPLNPPTHCRFRTRCPYAMPLCAQIDPAPVAIGNDHWVACHLAGEGSAMPARPGGSPA